VASWVESGVAGWTWVFMTWIMNVFRPQPLPIGRKQLFI
jgi:hypothetical protein